MASNPAILQPGDIVDTPDGAGTITKVSRRCSCRGSDYWICVLLTGVLFRWRRCYRDDQIEENLPE